MPVLDLEFLIYELENPISVLNEEGLFVYVNKAYANLFGYKVEELQKSERGIFGLLDEKSIPVYKEYFEKALKEETYYEAFHTKLEDFKHKDGSDVFVKARERSFVSANKKPYRVSLLNLQEDVMGMSEIIQKQKLEALGRLAGGVAHEINNLLQPILLFAEMVEANMDEAEVKNKHALTMIKESTLRARDIVEDILVFTRNDKPTTEALRLDQCVLQSMVFLKEIVPPDVHLNLEGIENYVAQAGHEEDFVRTDKNAMTQILLNLINNAMYAMENKGKITLNIQKEDVGAGQAEALGVEPGLFLNLQIGDTGCGMSPQVVSEVFEPFYTTKTVGEGTGLGLSVVYGLIKGWDGGIMIDSTEDEGTTINMYFPVVEVKN